MLQLKFMLCVLKKISLQYQKLKTPKCNVTIRKRYQKYKIQNCMIYIQKYLEFIFYMGTLFTREISIFAHAIQ
jgi:hypothetical protein